MSVAGLAVVSSPFAVAQQLDAAQALFHKGDYGGCLEACAEITPQQPDYPAFAALEMRALMETGRNEDAVERGMTAWRRARYEPEVTLALADALRSTGQTVEAGMVARQALQIRPDPPVAGRSRQAVAYGSLLLAEGADGKEVLTKLFEPAKKADPTARFAYLAIGNLGLKHHDRQLAAENFREGLKRFPGDPEFALGLEQSGVELPAGERKPDEGIASYLDVALRANPKFSRALLYKADRLAGGRDTAKAGEVLREVIKNQPEQPEAWAKIAALALLEENAAAAKDALAHAYKLWAENPRVAEIVGNTLAGHYRFAEGIVYLRQAAGQDPDSPSIHFELGSNQLRFGQLDEGWVNVAKAHELDPYHVAAFNLITLRDKLKGFPVREKDDVLVRMSPEDMAVFGARALDLAARAKRTLAEKYQVKLEQPVMVEMLPKQEDFAIRTFGLPGGESFLGVCFGPLITTTSPRGRLGRSNWQAVVWHEMAHTITLAASRHRIPRWLSEGISVYEERQVHAGWGQGMNSQFRGRILKGEIPPIAKLDEAFAGPDIMLGYYQASLVAEFVVERFGIKAMRSILSDLSKGTPVEKALAARTLPLETLETEFLEYAKKRASAYGKDLDWTPLADEEYLEFRKDPKAWDEAHPLRYASAMMWVSQLLEEGNWAEAQSRLGQILAAEPDNREDFSPYQALAQACKGLGDATAERAALRKWLEIDSNASAAAARLLQLGADLPTAERLADSERMMETNPFQEQAYRTMIAASKSGPVPASSREAYLSLLALDPLDSGRLRYELATLLRDKDRTEARRQVLKALEDNPRFEAALEFLIQLPPSP